MKQLIQSYKTGELGLFDVPYSACEPNGLIVASTAFLVSAVTVKVVRPYLQEITTQQGKSPSRPGETIHRHEKQGGKNILGEVFTKLNTPIPLGYRCAGRVLQVGDQVDGFSVGDRVACGGAG